MRVTVVVNNSGEGLLVTLKSISRINISFIYLLRLYSTSAEGLGSIENSKNQYGINEIIEVIQ